MPCKVGKECESKCGDNEFISNLADQASNKCKYFEPLSLAMEAKRRYKLDQHPWICSNKHDVSGVEEGKEATPCPVCKESFGDFLIAYLTSRLTTLGLDAENGLNRMFFKAAGVPGSISYDQFLRCFLGSHGQAGSGVRRAAGVSAKMPCTNQRTQPSVDLKEIFPKFIWGQGVQSDQDCSSFGCNLPIRKPGHSFQSNCPRKEF